MLSGTSVKPPQLDEFLLASDGKFRVADLAALGWSEQTLLAERHDNLADPASTPGDCHREDRAD